MATDDVGIQSVEILANGVSLGPGIRRSPSSHLYYVTWDTTSVSDGPVVFSAVAIDSSGNPRTSEDRRALVDNTAPSSTFVTGPGPYTNQNPVPFTW